MMRSLIPLFVAALLVGCESAPGTNRLDEHDDVGTAGIQRPFQLRMLEPSRLSLTVYINGEVFPVDRPDAGNLWLIRPVVDPGRSVNLTVEWRGTVGRGEGSSVLLATLSTTRPPVAEGDVIAIGRENYDTNHDEDGDGAINLEELVFGSDPFESSDAPPVGFSMEVPMTDSTQEPTVPPSVVMTEAPQVDPVRGPADVPGSDFYRFTNNGARLQGPVIGSGAVPPSLLARSIPFRVGSSEAGLELLHVSVTPNGGGQSSIVMTLANRSTAVKCGVTAFGLYVGAGDSEQNASLFFNVAVAGARGRKISGEALDTFRSDCMGPGSFAYLQATAGSPADSVTDLSIDSIGSIPEPTEIDPIRFEPVSYRVGAGAFFVTIANRGDVPVRQIDVRSFMLDDDGYPTGMLFTRSVNNVIAPGEEIELRFDVNVASGDFNFFQGRVSTIRVVATFVRESQVPSG